MKLWILKLKKKHTPWYDRAFSFVIQTDTEIAARKLASKMCGDEGPTYWLDPTRSSCKELLVGKTKKVIIRDFRHG